MSSFSWRESLASRISEEERSSFDYFVQKAESAGCCSFVLEARCTKHTTMETYVGLCVSFSYGMMESQIIFEKKTLGKNWNEIECPFDLGRFQTYALLCGYKATLKRNTSKDGPASITSVKLTVSCS